ncbi:MAG: hypothetical protein J5J06_05540 [Phycisphaerae bacterium]|nr:hypothetical protein [Phycisphaerae bacterium]
MLAEVTLTLTDWSIVAGMIGLPMGWVAWSLSGMRKDQREGRERLERELHDGLSRMDNKAREFDAKLWELEQSKAGKADWVRSTLVLQRGQQQTIEALRTVEGKLDATLGIGGSLSRIAKAMEEKSP